MKLSLCLVVKPDNNEAKLLDRCLNSVANYVDEICITVSGKNKEIERVAEKYKAKVSFFKWNNNFADIRNYNFSQATGDYILWLDVDDVLEGGKFLKKIIENMEKNGVNAGVCDYLYDFDKWGQCVVTHRKTRIIKNNGFIKWVGQLHEDLLPAGKISPDRLRVFLLEDIRVIHKTTDERKIEAQKRNLEMALLQLNKNPSDPKCVWDVANAYLAIGKFKEAIDYYVQFIPISGSEEEKFLAWHRMAEALKKLDRPKEAIEAEWEAIKLRPWYPDGYLGIGEIYYLIGKPKYAKEFLIMGLAKDVPKDTAIVYNPRDYDYNPLQILARVYFQLSKPKEAKKCLEHCLKLYPKDEETKNIIKQLDVEIKNLEKIDEIYEKAKKAKSKKEIKKLLDGVPDYLKCHPKLIHLKNIHFIKKESSGRDLVIYCYQTSEEFNPELILERGTGGSEEAVYHMSKRLANLGWNVVVYANCGYKEKRFGKVIWRPWWSFNPRDKQDILIVWRHPSLFDIGEINAEKKYVWLHDILEQVEFTPQRLKEIDKIITLSEWQRNLFPKIPDEKFMISNNGIDVKMFNKKVERNPYRLIYTSSYDRGLETLLKLFPLIKKEVPQAELHIFYGWNIFDQIHSNNPEMIKMKEKIIKLMDQDGVYEYGRVPQEQIIDEYLKSSIWAYPTEFGEISCISAMKAQAAGCIPITTNVAALDETVQFGLKIDSKNIYTDEDAQKEWVRGVINVLKNPPTEKEREEMKQWAKKKFNWDLVAQQWHKEFLKKISPNKIEEIRMDRFNWIKSQCSKDEKIVDIGGNKGHTFNGCDRKNIVTVDIDDYSNLVENFVRADAHHLPFKDKSFNTAVLAEILEHVENPIQVLKEAKRVAKKIIITVPNEYEWEEELNPFMPAEEAAKKQGLTLEGMVKRDNPAKELYSADKYKHLFHNRYYTYEMLENHLKEAGIKNYKISKLIDDKFIFWVVVCD